MVMPMPDEKDIRQLFTMAAQTTQQVSDVVKRMDRSESEDSQWRRDMQRELREITGHIQRLVDGFQVHLIEAKTRDQQINDLDQRVTILEGFRSKVIAFTTAIGAITGFLSAIVAHWLASNIRIGLH